MQARTTWKRREFLRFGSLAAAGAILPSRQGAAATHSLALRACTNARRQERDAMSESVGNITVRRAGRVDRTEAERVFDAAFATIRHIYRPTNVAARRQKRRFHEGVRLVAVRDNVVVGTVQLGLHSDHIFVSGLAVDPGHRRCGVARAIIDFVVDTARSEACDRVELETIAQSGNVPIFLALGFVVVSEHEPTWCTSDDFEVLTSVRMQRFV